MRKYIFLLLLLFSHPVLCTTITASMTGNWASGSTWVGGIVPTNSDNVIIPAGIDVTINTAIGIMNLGPVITVTVSGTLTLVNSSLVLDYNDIFRINSGGVVTAAGLGGGSIVVASLLQPSYTLALASGTSYPGPVTITNGILPITLLYFKGIAENSENFLLTWASASEKDFDYYSVERSPNAEEFESVGIVKGAGTSVIQKNYEYRDANPYEGIWYYRLKAVDFDGGTTIFNLVEISHDGTIKALSVFPNPVNNHVLKFQLNFQPSSSDYYVLMRSDGSIASSSTLQKTLNEFEVAQTLSPGIYLLEIFSSQRKYFSRVVVE